MLGKQHAYALVRDWLGPQPEVDREAALAELARRYLAGHGPADDRDLARWAGLPLRDARAGLAAIAAELERARGRPGRAGRRRRPPRSCRRRACSAPSTRCCSAGPRARRSSARTRQLVTINGIFRPFAMVEGRAVGDLAAGQGEGHDRALGTDLEDGPAALDADAADVERFMENH